MPPRRRKPRLSKPAARSFERRFREKIDTGTEYDDCHLWRGAVDEYGYGKVRTPNGATTGCHIVAWELATGNAVPEGWHVDHLCRIRRCCNADHLEAVPHAENVLRGESFSARNARKTHCPRGHEYTEDNIRWHSGRRECRTCVNQRDRERRAEKKRNRPEDP